MRRRLGTAVLAIALAGTALAPGLAVAKAPTVSGYEHLWKLQGIASGETGTHVRTVERSELQLTRDGDDLSGTLAYADRVGATSGDTFSQASEIVLVLVGKRVTGRQVAAGSFTGTATLTLAEAASPEAGARPSPGAPPRGVVTYRVAGRWVADLDGVDAFGELLYEMATPLSAEPPDAVVRDASWFNRLSDEFPDNLGAPQAFAVRVGGEASAVSGRAAMPLPVIAPDDLAAVARVDVALGALAIHDVGVDLPLAGVYLDAKNRAAGLLGEDGPTGIGSDTLALAWTAVRGADGTATAPSVLAATAAAAREVRDADIPRTGPLADSVLAAADSPEAPETAVVVERMTRAVDLDPSESTTRSPLPVFVLLLRRTAVDEPGPVVLPDGRDVTMSSAWQGFRRADGTPFWLPEPGSPYALTDGSLLGWGYQSYRAILVDSAHVGRVEAAYPLSD